MKHATGREHVEFAIEARDAADDPDAILERVGLAGDGDQYATGYSRGMTQRLALGMALVDDPDLLILDEPSGGLDPHGVRSMREIVRAERDRGATVFFSSHILEQVEAVADRVGIMADGALIAVDTIDGLRRTAGESGRLTLTLDRSPETVVDALRELAGVSVIGVDGNTVSLSCPDRRKVAAIDVVRREGAAVLDIETAERSLEDLFVEYTAEAA
jgi:ABC-2 type transport system ATP-binding protein